jgi:hypothetical protein
MRTTHLPKSYKDFSVLLLILALSTTSIQTYNFSMLNEATKTFTEYLVLYSSLKLREPSPSPLTFPTKLWSESSLNLEKTNYDRKFFMKNFRITKTFRVSGVTSE